MAQNNSKTERFGFIVTPIEKEVIQQLAELEGGLSQSALVRRLIRNAANERGLWPPTANQQKEQTND